MQFPLTPLGDSALCITLGSGIDEPTRLRIHSVLALLTGSKLPGVLDVVPGFTTVTVHYDPIRSGWETIRARVETVLMHATDAPSAEGRLVSIPVCYETDLAPDLQVVASHASMSPAEVVALHTAREYPVHFLGFLPGFAYLGGLDARIAAPRRATPRDKVPAGSVGIGGLQTGVYPLESPGGWQLIGRSPAVLFDPQGTPPTLLSAGDRVRFVAIDRAEFDRQSASA